MVGLIDSLNTEVGGAMRVGANGRKRRVHELTEQRVNGIIYTEFGGIYRTVTVTILYSTIQYSTIQYSTIQYNTVQYNTVQYSTIL